MYSKTMNTSKILILEDDPLLTKLYTSTLSGAGFEIDAVTSGKEGLEKLVFGGYALVLLDIMLPEMDGLSVLQELKSRPPKTPNGPIIAITNLTGGAIEQEALALGAKECISKVKLAGDVLVQKVKEWIQQ